MTPSDKLMVWASIASALATAGFAYLFDVEGPWWVYAIIWLFGSGMFYDKLADYVARERVINRDLGR